VVSSIRPSQLFTIAQRQYVHLHTSACVCVYARGCITENNREPTTQGETLWGIKKVSNHWANPGRERCHCPENADWELHNIALLWCLENELDDALSWLHSTESPVLDRMCLSGHALKASIVNQNTANYMCKKTLQFAAVMTLYNLCPQNFDYQPEYCNLRLQRHTATCLCYNTLQILPRKHTRYTKITLHSPVFYYQPVVNHINFFSPAFCVTAFIKDQPHQEDRDILKNNDALYSKMTPCIQRHPAHHE